MMGYYDFGYGMGFFGWIMMALFWGAVIWLIVWLVNQNRHPNNHVDNQSERRTPQEILKERYAKGEISKKEFDEMKKDLSKE
jgi:putative membrane protein